MLKRKVAYSGLEEALQRRRRRRRRMKSEDHNSLTPITAEARNTDLEVQKRAARATFATTAGQTVAHPAADESDILIAIAGQAVERDSDLEVTQRSTKKRKPERHKNRHNSGRYEGRGVDKHRPCRQVITWDPCRTLKN